MRTMKRPLAPSPRRSKARKRYTNSRRPPSKCGCRTRADLSSGPTTIDALAGGRIEIEQSRGGYRFGLDAHILATGPLPLGPGAHVVDLGAGQGAVSLLLALQYGDITIDAIEREASLFELLERNVERNSMSRIHPIEGDIRQIESVAAAHHADLVLCNPPFYRAGEGRQSPNSQRRAAHQELHGGLPDFVRAAAFVLKPSRGAAKFVLPPARLEDFFRALEGTDLRLERLRPVQSRADQPAYLFEGLARRQSRAELEIMPPLVVFDHQGDYTDEMRERLDP